jgi:hypothetical protein
MDDCVDNSPNNEESNFASYCQTHPEHSEIYLSEWNDSVKRSDKFSTVLILDSGKNTLDIISGGKPSQNNTVRIGLK